MLSSSKGFSLVELMVVVAIVSLMAIVSVPSMTRGIPKYRVKSSATDLAAKLRKARWVAVKEKRDVSATFDTSRNNYIVDGTEFPRTGGLSSYYGSGVTYGVGATGEPQAVDCGGADIKTLSFNSQGLLEDGDAVIHLINNKNKVYRVRITAAGSIVVQNWTGGDWDPS